MGGYSLKTPVLIQIAGNICAKFTSCVADFLCWNVASFSFLLLLRFFGGRYKEFEAMFFAPVAFRHQALWRLFLPSCECRLLVLLGVNQTWRLRWQSMASCHKSWMIPFWVLGPLIDRRCHFAPKVAHCLNTSFNGKGNFLGIFQMPYWASSGISIAEIGQQSSTLEARIGLLASTLEKLTRLFLLRGWNTKHCSYLLGVRLYTDFRPFSVREKWAEKSWARPEGGSLSEASEELSAVCFVSSQSEVCKKSNGSCNVSCRKVRGALAKCEFGAKKKNNIQC